MLPRSLFAASPGQRQSESPTRSTQQRTQRTPASTAASNAVDLINAQLEQEEDQLDSTDSEEGHTNDNGWEGNNLNALMAQLCRQQERQKKYIEKTHQLSLAMDETRGKISKLLGLSVEPARAAMARTQRAVPDDSVTSPIRAQRSAPDDPLASPPRTQTGKRVYNEPLSGRSKVIRQETYDLAESKTVPRAIAPQDISSVAPSSRQPQANPRGSDRTRVAYKNTCDLFLQTSTTVRKNVFSRKPRGLLINTGAAETQFKDILVTTSLAGDMPNRRIIKEIPSDDLFGNKIWVQDFTWISPSSMVLCPMVNDDVQAPISVVHLDSADHEDATYHVQKFHQFPHGKTYSVIEAVTMGANGTGGANDRASFVTGANDRHIFLWDMVLDPSSKNYRLLDVTGLKIPHTSAVQAFKFDDRNQALLSGGKDSRLFIYDTRSQRVANEYKTVSPVRLAVSKHLEANYVPILDQPYSPELQTKDEQFRLFDRRDPSVSILNFGTSSQDSFSRYLRPDWHTNGYMVVCGSQDAAKLNFWDIRYTGVRRGPCFSMQLGSQMPQDGRPLLSQFLPGQNRLMSLTSARTLEWIDYNIQHDATLHSF
ncbi:hypothetical protein BCR43DRAFT_481609 [Syncephalastrum racemosum]|uniref:Uncharacterized protein n=1 Tax=Syncephalastrum racemosum TaxID=13706 RepID=A0A1X2HTP9_SYNRA|nr:hypothetical protein BCR43DRAFT_481609 [Syncephalastrum racemosum]